METPETSGWRFKPELKRHQPEGLCDYARDRQRWNTIRLTENYHKEAMEDLVEELRFFIADQFETLPEVSIIASDIIHTNLVETEKGLTTIIEADQLQFVGDESIYHEHRLTARIAGYHLGKNNELRMYATTQEPSIDLMGGVYIPYLSVDVETSTIQFPDVLRQKNVTTLKQYVEAHSGTLNHASKDLIELLYNTLSEKNKPKEMILKECS